MPLHVPFGCRWGPVRLTGRQKSEKSLSKGGRLFYGWIIVAAGYVVQVLNGGLLFHAFSAYVLPLQQEFGWNRTLLASAFALIRMESGILGPLQSWMIDRFGPRRVMTVGNVLFAQVNSLTTFYAALAVVGLGSSLGGFMPIAATVTQWFARRRSTALDGNALRRAHAPDPAYGGGDWHEYNGGRFRCRRARRRRHVWSAAGRLDRRSR